MTLADLMLLAAAALLFVPLERLLPLHRGQTTARPGMGVDVLHLFASGFLIRTGATAVTVILALGAASIVPGELRELVRAQPVWVQFVELLLLSDLCFYTAHRIVHSVPWMWRFHAVHHSSEQMDWLATYRVHPLDQIFNSSVIALPAIALGFAPLALLVYAFLYRWQAMLLHSNVRVEFGVLGLLFATPRFHHWHHADEPDAYNKNFGGQLAIWDRLFGTAYDERTLPARYGSGGVPASYLGQLCAPFAKPAATPAAEAVRDHAVDNPGYAATISRDAGIYAFIAMYLALCLATAVMLGTGHKFRPLMFSGIWLEYLAYGLLGAVIVAGCASLFAAEPMTALRGRLARIFAPRMCAGILMILAISVFSGLFTSFKTMLTDLAPFTADAALTDLDAALHGGDAWRLLPAIPAVTFIIEKLYFPIWTFLLLASVASASFLPACRPIRSQYLWTYVLAWSLLGNVVALFFMSAGPIFTEQVTGSQRFVELTTYVSTHAPMTSEVRDWLWTNYASHQAGPASGISAFPSLHLSLATLFVLQAWHLNRRLGFALAGFCAAILVGSVHLGWHYAIDGYFSIIATFAIWKATGWVLNGNLQAVRERLSLAAADHLRPRRRAARTLTYGTAAEVDEMHGNVG